MPELSIPTVGGQPLVFNLQKGEVLFVLGANGTGKSGLMQRLNRDHHENSRWISAHRQSWFESDSISISPQQKKSAEHNIRNQDREAEARWKDYNASARPNIAIYELVEAANADARAIERAVRQEDTALVQRLKIQDPPLKVINELLRCSNLPITLSIEEGEQVMASKSGSKLFSVARLSDGERNAVIIAANVLTAKPGTLILIDEPERHLHRSIISPLLTQLFGKRNDCAFIVSTHDILLPLDNPSARTLLIRGCTYAGHDVGAWTADLVTPETELDEALKIDIFGARKKILFVEGTGRSLDQRLYSLVFPEVSVIAKSSCRDVEHAVTGIRGAASLLWLKAFGIVDSDGRPPEVLGELPMRGIYAVPSYSVEALYYHPLIQERVAERHAKVTGRDSQTMCQEAKVAAISALAKHADRMCKRVAEKAVRATVLQQLPTKSTIETYQAVKIEVDISAEIARERARFDGYVAKDDLLSLIQRYPIRETPAPTQIADALGFQNRDQYENAVLKLLMDDATSVESVRVLFQGLWHALNSK